MKSCLALVLAAAFTGGLRAANEPAAKPNILFILGDDSGIDGLGCYGSDRFKGKTPNIDKLAETGMLFKQCYAEPVCGPSRCTIMTGRYVFRTGGTTNQSASKPSYKSEPSVARTLKEAGYVTGMAGKWRQMSDTPGNWGFDEWVTDQTASGWFWANHYIKNGQKVETKEKVYNPDVCLDFTKEFIRRNKEKLFYFYFSSHLIHGPIHATPDSQGGKAGRNGHYVDDMVYLDKQVGLLVAELEKQGLREKTLIVFSFDNGTAKTGAAQSFINGRKINGMKGSVLEGGSRVPLIANWKGTVPAGKVNNDLIDFSDFYATFADLAGEKMPTGVTLDSRSFASQIKGEKGVPREWVFVQLGQNWYAREHGFKLTESGALYDMSDAPFTEKAVPADSASEEAKAARARLQAILSKLNPGEGNSEVPKKKKKKAAAASE